MKHINDPPCRTCKRPTSVCRSRHSNTYDRPLTDGSREWSIAECAPKPRRTFVTYIDGITRITSSSATSWSDRAEPMSDEESVNLDPNDVEWLLDVLPQVVAQHEQEPVEYAQPDDLLSVRAALVGLAWWLCSVGLPWLLQRYEARSLAIRGAAWKGAIS